MVWCRTPDFCDRLEIDNGIYDPKSKIILPRNVKQKDKYVQIRKNQYCVVWKKTR